MTVPTTTGTTPADSSTTRHQPRTTRSVTRELSLLAILIIGVLLLWPAKWGGVFGIVLVNGHSMEPTFHTGDVVISMKATSYQRGDIIAYEVSDSTIGKGGHVIHRIVGITRVHGEPVFTTRGDNNPSDDPWTVSSHDVFGRKIIAIPAIGKYMVSSHGSLLLGGVLAVAVIIAVWPSSSRHSKHARRGQSAHGANSAAMATSPSNTVDSSDQA